MECLSLSAQTEAACRWPRATPEIQFTGALHKNDEPWFLQQLPATAEYIVTTIPGTAARLQADRSVRLGGRTRAACSAPHRRE
ncbi:DUF4862 family protein [Arthrobacter sp. NPDC093128]|uniref:DUF4862 family protein n=1 Tax=Arthrobacter sp. NPDC093128 TaxID=3154979 RepID=UPI0034352CC1